MLASFILVYTFISYPSGASVVQKVKVQECKQAIADTQYTFSLLQNKAKLVAITCGRSPISQENKQ